MKPRGAGVLYVLSEKFQLYSSISPTILEFPVTPELVRQQHVVNKARLQEEIVTFLLNHAVQPTNLVMILANNIGHISETPPSSTPDIVSRRILTSEGTRFYNASHELLMTIKGAFEKRGFTIDHIMPGLAFGSNIGNAPTLTPENITLVYKQTPLLEKYNFLKAAEEEMTQPTIAATAHRRRDMFRLYAAANIIGVFTIAFLVYWNSTHPDAQTNRSKADDKIISVTPSPFASEPTPSVTPTPTLTLAPSR